MGLDDNATTNRHDGNMNRRNAEILGSLKARWAGAWPTAPWAPLALIWSGFGLVVAFVMWCWGSQGWPLGSYWWDDLALSGGVHAIRTGLRPTVDFWAPFILPLYLKLFAQDLAGVAAGYVAECLLQGAAILVLLSVLLGRVRHSPSVYLCGVWVVALAILPFNLGSIAEAQLGSVAFAGSYNRFGSALIGLVLMMPMARRDESRDGVLVPWLAGVFVLAFFTKITVFQIAFAICLAHAILCGGAGSRSVLLKATLLAALASVLVLQWFDGGGGYLSALKDMSELRMIGMQERLETCLMLLAHHRLELFVMVLVALLVAVRGLILRQAWAGQVSCYLAAVLLITLYTLTNFGDNGLAPAVVAMQGLLFLQTRESRADERVASDAALRHASLLRRITDWMWAGLGTAYVVLHIHYALTFSIASADSRVVPIPVSTSFFARNHTVSEQAWLDRTPISVRGVPVNERSPRTYAAYVAGLDEAASFLAQTVPDRSKSVYALDFPAYVFSLVEGYRVPRGGYPWLLYGHELTIDFHPAPAVLLADVDVLMVSRCSIALGNRRFLARIYRVELENNWRKLASLTCWDVYERK